MNTRFALQVIRKIVNGIILANTALTQGNSARTRLLHIALEIQRILVDNNINEN